MASEALRRPSSPLFVMELSMNLFEEMSSFVVDDIISSPISPIPPSVSVVDGNDVDGNDVDGNEDEDVEVDDDIV